MQQRGDKSSQNTTVLQDAVQETVTKDQQCPRVLVDAFLGEEDLEKMMQNSMRPSDKEHINIQRPAWLAR